MLKASEFLISLDYEPSDLAVPENRASFQNVSRQLEIAGIPPTRLMHFRNGTIMAAVVPLGPYLLPIAQIVIPTLGAILVARVKTRGRRVRVKVGDTKIEATSVEEVGRLISHLEKLQAIANNQKPSA